MALIKCPECGNMISSMANICPRCGCPIGNARKQQYGGDERTVENHEHTRVIYKKKDDSNKWLYAVIALLASIILGGGAYYFLNKNKDKDTPTTEVAKDTPADTTATSRQEEPATAPAPTEQAATVTTPPPVKRNKVANGNYRLNGSITYKETYYFDMEIQVNGNKVTGWYIVHNGENIPVNLSGSIDANGNMKLKEYKGGSTTGYYFTGNFNQARYSGKYLCTFRNLPMRFSASAY